jgi:hypothetical protein
VNWHQPIPVIPFDKVGDDWFTNRSDFRRWLREGNQDDTKQMIAAHKSGRKVIVRYWTEGNAKNWAQRECRYLLAWRFADSKDEWNIIIDRDNPYDFDSVYTWTKVRCAIAGIELPKTLYP